MRQIARAVKDLQVSYPNIRYHLYSGNEDDVTDRIDKGLLDFGLPIQPAHLSKYNYINILGKDVWGVVMRKDMSTCCKSCHQCRRYNARSINLFSTGYKTDLL